MGHFKPGDEVKISNIKCDILKKHYKEGEIALSLTYDTDRDEMEALFPDGNKWFIGGDLCDVELIHRKDNLNSSSHYNQGYIECIDAIQAALTQEEFKGFLKGNALKYLWRMQHKGNPFEDVQKAGYYINKLEKTL